MAELVQNGMVFTIEDDGSEPISEVERETIRQRALRVNARVNHNVVISIGGTRDRVDAVEVANA